MDEIPGPARTVGAVVLQWFVNRERELRRFRDMLTGADATQVLVVEGPSGIGKSWLLSRLQQEANTHTIPAAIIDFSSGEAADDLWLIQRAAVDLGSHYFPTLNVTLAKATQLEVVLKVESSPGSGGVTLQGETITIRGDVADRDIIKDNKFYIQSATSPEVRRIWHENINGAFFKDLALLGTASGVALLFDSFEKTTREGNGWIENRLLRLIGDGKLPGVRMVIASEQAPRFSPAWRALVAELRLDLLPGAEVSRYLKDRRRLIISEETVAVVYEVTQGRPDLVALIADNPEGLPEKPDVDRLLALLVEAILTRAEAPIPETLRLVAIPEWFDAALLADLLETPVGVDERLTNLQYSFVQDDGRGHWRLAPAVRETLLKSWVEQPLALKESHRRAMRHFEQRARDAADPGLCEELERQALGHMLVVNERDARDRLLVLFEKAEAAHRLTTAELLLQRAQAVEDLTDLTQAWLHYLRGRLAFARNDLDGSARLFEALLKASETGAELQALANWSLGQVASERGHWAEAISQYEVSLRYFQGQGDQARAGQVMLALGKVYLQQAQALGGLIGPRSGWVGKRSSPLSIIVAFLVTLPFVFYAWAIQRWRFLPPLHHGINYRNWTLMRLLLTAAQWYREAEAYMEATRREALLADARQGLAQAYHQLGWWHAAGDLFSQVLSSTPVVSNAYRQAHVRQALADTQLSAGETDAAIAHLEKSLETFENYQDIKTQAQTQALLGQAWLRKGEFERGLALYQKSLEAFRSTSDRLGTGQALHTLRRWLEESNPPPDETARVEALITSLREKTYLPRISDRLAVFFERALLVSLTVLGVSGIVAVALALLSSLSSPQGFITLLLDALIRLAAVAVIIIVGSNVLAVALISWSARRKPEPERLDWIVTGEDDITRYDYRGQPLNRIPWQEVQAVLFVERMIWRKPTTLSEFRLFGLDTAIRIPGTMLWYDALKQDVEDHLQRRDVQPVRRRRDLRILWSKTGLLFVSSPLLTGLGFGIVKGALRQMPAAIILARNVADVATAVGPALMILGLIAFAAPVYWWLFLHPLWVRYTVTQRSWVPVVTGTVGLGIVAFAFALSYWLPFFAFRNWLDQTVHPLGFVLILVSPLWVLTARKWAQKPFVPGAPAYPLGARVVAALLLLAAMLLTGLFAQREWIPYAAYILPAIARFYHEDYAGTIAYADRAEMVNKGFADIFYYRGRAHFELGRISLKRDSFESAEQDFTTLIESGNAIPADYLARAEAREKLGNLGAACEDLQKTLDVRLGSLSETDREQVLRRQQEWNCPRLEKITPDGTPYSGSRRLLYKKLTKRLVLKAFHYPRVTGSRENSNFIAQHRWVVSL